MTLSFIILAQSPTGAVITVIGLGLVFAIIGYFTAWFYAKSVYTPIIKGLEAEKADLQKQVAGLKEDVARLNGKVDELKGNIAKLEEAVAQKDKEIKELKSKITH